MLDTAPPLCAPFRLQNASPTHYAHYFFLNIGYNYSNYLRDILLFKEAFFTKLDSKPPSHLKIIYTSF